MKLSGNLEVFKNQRGYVTGVFKAWDEDTKAVLGKAYIDVALPEGTEVKDGQTLTLNVKEGYLNAVFCKGKESFTKLKINVVECEVIRVFPEEKKEKPSKRGAK